MNAGKTLFAQVMEFVPWKSFSRIIDRHHGDAGVSELSCADVFRAMAFAQLTGLDSIRGVHVCLGAMSGKLFHMGMKGTPGSLHTLGRAESARLAHLSRAGHEAHCARPCALHQ